MEEIVGLILAAVVGLLSVAKGVYEYRQTRVAPPSTGSTPTPQILRLETEREKHITHKEWIYLKLFLVLILVNCIVIFAVVCAYSGIIPDGFEGLSPSVIIWTVVGLTYAVSYGLLVAYFLSLTWGHVVGEPLHKSTARVVVKGDLPSVMRQCQDALTSMNVIRAKGTQLIAKSDQHVTLEAGTSGRKIIIDVDRCANEAYSIGITSASYYPSLFMKRRISSNLARILQRFYQCQIGSRPMLDDPLTEAHST